MFRFYRCRFGFGLLLLSFATGESLAADAPKLEASSKPLPAAVKQTPATTPVAKPPVAKTDAPPATKPAEQKPIEHKPAEQKLVPPKLGTPEAKPKAIPEVKPEAKPEPKPAAKPAPKPAARKLSPEQISALVVQLGDVEYSQRLAAEVQLKTLGLDSQQALLAGLKHTDPQIQRSCRQLLSTVLELDYQQRLASFLADTGNKLTHDLPGWNRYSQIVGVDKSARSLYLEMVRAEGGLLASADAGDASAAEALQLRFQQIYQMIYNRDPRKRKQPTLGSIASLLFVHGDPRLKLPSQVLENPYWSQVMYSPALREALTKAPTKIAVTKLLGSWIKRPSGPNLLHQKLRLATQYKIPEGLDLAIHVLTEQKNLSPSYKAYAVQVLGQMGGKKYTPNLAGLLEDKGVCTQLRFNNKLVAIQIRDVALGWLIHLTGQDHKAYGMNRAKSAFDRLKQNPQYSVNYTYCAFDSTEARDIGMKKWAEWVKKHPLPAALPPKEESTEEPKAEKAAAAAAQANPAVKQVIKGFAVQFAAQVVLPGARIVVGGPNGAAKVDAEKGDEESMLGLLPADRLQLKQLKNAEELIQEKNYHSAAQILGEILLDDNDYSFRPNGAPDLMRGFKGEAERLLREMPGEGHAAYRLQFGPTARRMLDEALKTHDVETIHALSRKYFYTDAGSDAAYLAGLHLRSRGQFLQAALVFHNLQRRARDASRFEPVLSFQLAECWSSAGLVSEARQTLLDLKSRQPAAKIRVAGKEHTLFRQSDEALDWLAGLIGPAPVPEAQEGWLVLRGNAQRNRSTPGGSPFLMAEQLTAAGKDPLIGKTVQELRDELLQEFRPALPTLHPIVIGRTLVVRTATEMQALDLDTGQLRWATPVIDTLTHVLQQADPEQRTRHADMIRSGLKRRIWNDPTFGTISSDGLSVFAVESLSFETAPGYQRMVVTREGRRQLDSGMMKPFNVLSAYDVTTGKLRWEAGGPEDEAGALSKTFFLGPPLPYAGGLYAIGMTEGQTRLLQLDAATGELLWSMTMSPPEEEPDPRTVRFRPMPMQLEPPQNRSGASPSSSGGVLVCPTSRHRFVAVDMLSRSVLWIYETREPAGPRRRIPNVWPPRMAKPDSSDLHDQWKDASVTIADGRALLTPAGDNRLYCLDVATGDLQWAVPRRAGLYVAGVERGRVIVVGRGSVWSVDLDTGNSAWPQSQTSLPPGSLPSGRGYLGDGQYCLPLASGEVISIDVATGQIKSRSRTLDSSTPGNLVRLDDSVISQSPAGVVRYPLLEARDKATSLALSQRPDDAAAIAARGEVALYQGKIAEAVKLLQTAYDKQPAEKTRLLLLDALAEGVRRDVDQFRPLTAELDKLIKNPAERLHIARHLAVALQESGKSKDAFASYMQLVSIKEDSQKLEHVEPARMVRRDRWIQARLTDLFAAATAADRAEIDALVAEQQGALSAEGFLNIFGNHPLSDGVRLKRAEELVQQKQWVPAENLLRQVMISGTPEQRASAIVRLAEMFQASNQLKDAAAAYAYINTVLADVVCKDGKTGQQVFAALPENDAVRRELSTDVGWAPGPVMKEISSQRASSSYLYPVTVTDDGQPLSLNLTLETDTSGRNLTAYDELGRTPWRLALTAPTGQTNYSYYMYSHAQTAVTGHALVTWMGDRVIASSVTGSTTKTLWTRQVIHAKPNDPTRAMMMPGRFRMLRRTKALPGSDGQMIVVRPSYTCFQEERKLVAVETISGKTLWEVDGMPLHVDLIGDDEYLLVTPQGTREAMVLSPLDGREIGRRELPPHEERMTTIGRLIVRWNPNLGGAELSVIDPWNGAVVWQRQFAAKSQPWLIPGGECGVLDQQGNLTLLQLSDGKPVLEAQVDATKSLEELIVMRNSDGYIVIANSPSEVAGVGNLVNSQAFAGSIPVGGRIYAFDRETGRRLWDRKVANQLIRVNQPADVPVLLFFSQIQKQVGRSIKVEQSMLCLDKRTGEELLNEAFNGSNNQYQMIADPVKDTLEVRSRVRSIKFTFGAKEEDVKAADAKAAAAKAATEKAAKAAAEKVAAARAAALKKAAEAKAAKEKAAADKKAEAEKAKADKAAADKAAAKE